MSRTEHERPPAKARIAHLVAMLTERIRRTVGDSDAMDNAIRAALKADGKKSIKVRARGEFVFEVWDDTSTRSKPLLLVDVNTGVVTEVVP